MKTVVALSLLAATASAFQTAQPKVYTSPSALKASDLDGTFGTTVETGNKCPPLGAMLLQDVGPQGMKIIVVLALSPTTHQFP